MSFYVDYVDTSKMDSFQHDIYDIKKYLCDIGNTYLIVAYRVYEMDITQNYKKHYKTIVEACQSELGFKKSTTYNMINIVKRFGEIEDGRISYNSLFSRVNQFSYSQLCEMLSLSDKQVEAVTPTTTVKELRQMKKVQTSGKVVEAAPLIDVEPSFIIAENGIEEVTDSSEPDAAPEPEEVLEVQTSGKDVFLPIIDKYDMEDGTEEHDVMYPYTFCLSEIHFKALKRFIKFCNSEEFTDYKLIDDILNTMKYVE